MPRLRKDKQWTEDRCRRKADQHYEMADLARMDGDREDERRQLRLACLWDRRRVYLYGA